MLIFTPSAISKVKEIIAERDASLCLRILASVGGCSGFRYQMSLDKQREDGDESLDFDGLNVLIDSQSMILMDGTTVDYVEAEDGSGFTFDNPNAPPHGSGSGCGGCGSGGGCSTE